MHDLPRSYSWLLGATVLSAFLTQTRFLPIRNNVGVFELLGGFLVVSVLVSIPTQQLRLHPIGRVSLALLMIAGLSQVNISHNRMWAGLINVAILGFLFLFLFGAENLIRRYRIHPAHILRLVAWSVLIVGPWIIVSGLQSPGDLDAAGPFRNRAHMGNYMLTAFWMVLGYSQTPGLRKTERWVAYSGIALTLYAVAASGRRSVYLSLAIGLVVLVTAFLLANREKRVGLAAAVVFVFTAIWAMYAYGGRALPQLSFFQERVGLIDDRLQSALVMDAERAAEETFFEMQREGVKAAFLSHPVLGIGWGGYAKSHWSPDRHEVHSTPLRFLAETGLIGTTLYAVLMASLWLTALRSFLGLRAGPWGPVAFIFLVALSSLAVSYLYNRHITERTFWLFAMTILAFDIALERREAVRRKAKARRASGRKPSLAPATASVATE